MNAFQRKFVNEVRRCEEMERKLSKYKEKFKDSLPKSYRIFRCISRDFKTEKFAPKIDLDLYTDDNFKVSKMCADFLICCSNLQIIYP